MMLFPTNKLSEKKNLALFYKAQNISFKTEISNFYAQHKSSIHVWDYVRHVVFKYALPSQSTYSASSLKQSHKYFGGAAKITSKK